MGVNDAREQLEVAKAEVVRLEQRVAELQALSARWAEVVNAPSFEAAVEADARAYHDSACAYRQERDSLARLHEVATERTVQLAAVIEKAKRSPTHEYIDFVRRVDTVYTVLATADTDAALREVRAKAWDEGFDAGERDAMAHETFDEPCITNPYREGSDG